MTIHFWHYFMGIYKQIQIGMVSESNNNTTECNQNLITRLCRSKES